MISSSYQSSQVCRDMRARQLLLLSETGQWAGLWAALSSKSSFCRVWILTADAQETE